MREIDTIDISFKQINRDILKGWVVFYYIDGQVIKYTSETHDWVDLPKIGVMYLYRVYDNYKEQVGGNDYYCPYQLMNVDDIRPWIKFGLYIDDEVFNSMVVPAVINDPINY